MVKVFSVFLFIGTMLFMSGCETIQEGQGYSRIPQNRPSTWETNPLQNVPR